MDENETPQQRAEKRAIKEKKWMETQIKGLTAWVNSYLAKRNQKIENVETDFADGVRLADFLELAGFYFYFLFFNDFYFDYFVFSFVFFFFHHGFVL